MPLRSRLLYGSPVNETACTLLLVLYVVGAGEVEF